MKYAFCTMFFLFLLLVPGIFTLTFNIFDLFAKEERSRFSLFSLYTYIGWCLLIMCVYSLCGSKKWKEMGRELCLWEKSNKWIWRIINRMKGRIRRVNIVVIKSITSITHVRLKKSSMGFVWGRWSILKVSILCFFFILNWFFTFYQKFSSNS